MKWGKPTNKDLRWWRWRTKIAGAFALLIVVFALSFLPSAVMSQSVARDSVGNVHSIVIGAERTATYVPLLKGKRVGVVTNHTGTIGSTHLVDSLLALKLNVVKVFAPEHGFRGDADAGEHVTDARDPRSGLPMVSLYGKNRKPTAEQLKDVDVLLFDIQDVGVRFYTYVGTLHYVMEAAAETHKPLIVLDRPDPNGYYVDGPVLDMKYSSFVGMHPVPLVHGMTVGEYARMINGEGWLKNAVKCELTVINCIGWDHTLYYEPPINPSPNLKELAAIYLYPSIGLFEGTMVSVGRGTDRPFECIGFPGCTLGAYSFTPTARPGAKDPPYKDQECRGMDLREYGTFFTRLSPEVHLHWLIGFYEAAPDKKVYFSEFFDRLAGGPSLREAVQRGEDEEHIRAMWKPQLDAFRHVRAKYLLYADFH